MSEFSKELVPQSLLGRYPLVGVVGQQLFQDILGIARDVGWQHLLQSHSLLGWEVELHMRGPALKPLQNLWSRSTQHVVNQMHLIELVTPGKQRYFLDEFKQHTPKSPDIHLFVVVAVSHQTLWRPIPSCADIFGIWLLTVPSYLIPHVTFAAAEVGQLH